MSGLSVSNLTFSYGDKTALDDVSFDVKAGTFCALLGPNGAGKSTLFSLLTRLLTTSEGRIEIAGHNLVQNPRAALSKLGIVFQQTTLDLDLSVRQNLTYFAALHGISGRDAKLRTDRALVTSVARKLRVHCSMGLTCCCWMNQPWGWMRRRVRELRTMCINCVPKVRPCFGPRI